MLCRTRDQIKHRPTVLMGSVNIKETQLIRPRRIIGNRSINRITRIPQANKIYAFHHAPIGHVKTGDDAGLQHGSAL